MNQSKLEANTCSWHEARENVRERVTIGFGFTEFWLAEKVARDFLAKANAINFRHLSENRSIFSLQCQHSLTKFIN